MPAVVNSIKPDSIAEDLELISGDEIISIDGIEPEDLLDYRYLIASEVIELHIKRKSGEEEIIEIEKDFDEDLGIVFESAVFDKVIPCTNKCVFCFVDQQPEGLRPSLYVKDDDYRLSCIQGTYVTLTNLNEKARNRIENLRPGPFYVSVHTTNPELRVSMLKNPKAGEILKELKWLNSLNIPMHTQIVLCPGLNDETELQKTLNDLANLDSILSIAVVPVGITRYREEGTLNKVTKEIAKKVISQVELFNKKIGYNLVFASDEFYILSETKIPSVNYYNGFGQLDDGVGSSRVLLDNFKKNKNKLPKFIKEKKKITIATGKTAAFSMMDIIKEFNNIDNLTVDLKIIKSDFWGEDVTVAGLITGSDLIQELSPIKDSLGLLVIPSVMLRRLTNQFLDNLTLEEVEKTLNTKIIVIEDYYRIDELIKLISN